MVTLSVAVSSSMSPRFTVVVYATTHDGEVVADALAVPVSVLNNMKVRECVKVCWGEVQRVVVVVVIGWKGG